MGRHTTYEEREVVIHHFMLGKSKRAIANIVNKSPSTVQHIIERFRENRIGNKVRISPKKAFSERDERWILNLVRDNPKISAPKIRVEVEKHLGIKVCDETIRIVLRNHGFNNRAPRIKPLISPKNKQRRLEFANRYYSHGPEFWNNVIFADESKFNVFGSDGKVRVWRKKNEELNLKNLQASVKHGGGSVMVWGCMAANGVGNIYVIDGNMDKFMYLQILKDNLHASARNLGLEGNFQFYQDNDPKHKSFLIREWMLYNCPKVIETPPQSPDLNVIEHLWDFLDDRIRQHRISSRNHLKQVILEEWAKIPSEFTKKLVESMPRRLSAVRVAKGLHTKY